MAQGKWRNVTFSHSIPLALQGETLLHTWALVHSFDAYNQQLIRIYQTHNILCEEAVKPNED
jgi:hypothetical protein